MNQDVQNFFDEENVPPFLTKRERKLQRKLRRAQYETEPQPLKVNIKKINPLTENQRKTFISYGKDQNLLLHGVAGTGKTFIALYLSLNSVICGERPRPVVILRSVVPSRDMGFLPGKLEDKIAVYEDPYRGLCSELTGHPTAYDYFKKHKIIEFSSTSFLRGMTFRDNTVIVDECQNMTFAELDTIMTRVGDGCRIIFCGDFRQSDLIKDTDRHGLLKFMNVLGSMKSFTSIEFTKDDIVRSKLVKEYIIAKLDKGIV